MGRNDPRDVRRKQRFFERRLKTRALLREKAPEAAATKPETPARPPRGRSPRS